MSDLVEFLRARLDEDERDAKAATPAPWEYDADDQIVYTMHDGPGGDLVGDEVAYVRRRGMEHIARHDPARVLAEVEAKRRILEEASGADWLPANARDDEPEYAYGIARAWNDALKLLALPYADHADYREEWRP